MEQKRKKRDKWKRQSQAQWRMPFNSSTRRWTQADLCEFKANLVYMMSSRPTGATKTPILRWWGGRGREKDEGREEVEREGREESRRDSKMYYRRN